MDWIDAILYYKEFKDKYVNEKDMHNINEIKNKICNYKDEEWRELVRKNNVYELVPVYCKPRKINRAYFKLNEVIHKYKLLDNVDKINSIHLAEGPGGFINCTIDMCKKKNIDHNWLAMTLNDVDNNVRFNKTLSVNNITYGEDGTGDLRNIRNIYYLLNSSMYRFNSKCNFVTADGGFDVSQNYNNQENSSLELFSFEVISALILLKKKGTFVMKIFDSYNLKTLYILFFLKKCFNFFDIHKPDMSRPCNSEKYVICKDFIGTDLINGSEFTSNEFQLFIKYISEMNHEFYLRQLTAINQITNKDTTMHINMNVFQRQIAKKYLEINYLS